MKYKDFNKLKKFVNSNVRFYNKDENIIEKGHIKLKIGNKIEAEKLENLPEIIKQIFFIIRMSCNINSDEPSEENLTLIGPTGFKEFIIKKWLENCEGNYNEKDSQKNF